MGAVGVGEWVEYDVTSVVDSDGVYTFGLVGDSGNGADFHSRDAQVAGTPELVIEFGSDVTAPETTIDTGPSSPTGAVDATFTFSADEAGSSFACSIDGAAFSACTSPVTYTGLADGLHGFEVVATDASGNADPTPAGWTWTVEIAVTALWFAAVADATVVAGSPDTNYGTQPSLEADLNSLKQAYLMFSVTGVISPVTNATLRLFVTNGTNDGPQLFGSDTSWSEGSVTWNTRPGRIGAALADLGRIRAGEWVEYDVTPLVTADGSYSFELAPQSNNSADFDSRQAGSNHPELAITLAGTETGSP